MKTIESIQKWYISHLTSKSVSIWQNLKQFDEEQTQKLGKENIVLQDVNDKFEPILSKKWSKFAEFLSQGENFFL